jgi:hypothetical protein
VAGGASRRPALNRYPHQPYKREIIGYNQNLNVGYKDGQGVDFNDNHEGQVIILTYPLLVPGAHHYEPDQAGRHIQEPVQYP